VICTASNERTLRALADAVLEKVKKDFGLPGKHVEGGAKSGWLLLDFGDVVVHLLSPALRRYYRLEDLWREGQVVVRMP
jgi:ribosome-associated protein